MWNRSSSIATAKRRSDSPAKLSPPAPAASSEGKEQNRYHKLELYKTTDNRYVLAINYHTQWQGELDQAIADIWSRNDTNFERDLDAIEI